MLTCSKELVSKNSKPYTSSSPMYRLVFGSFWVVLFMRSTTKLKRRAYTILTTASRESIAW